MFNIQEKSHELVFGTIQIFFTKKRLNLAKYYYLLTNKTTENAISSSIIRKI